MDTIPLFYAYNLASTSYIYGRFGPPQCGRKFVKTANSSTTTFVEANSGDGSLDELSVGDLIWVNRGDTTDLRTVASKASGASGTVSANVNWYNGDAGYAYQFRKFQSGTAVTDGWIGCGNHDDKIIVIQIDTLNATSIDMTIETRVPGSAPMTLFTKNFTAATVASNLNSESEYVIPDAVEFVRVGFKINTDTGTQSISAWYRGRKAAR